jgi:hypothetical protein
VKATRRQREGWRNALRRLSEHGLAGLKGWTGRTNYERPVFTGSRRTTENSDPRSVRELKNTIKERQKEDNYSELRSTDKTQQQRRKGKREKGNAQTTILKEKLLKEERWTEKERLS